MVNENTIINIYTFDNIEYLSKEHMIHMLLKHILFNFEIGIFYLELREKTGLVYNINLYNNISIQNSKESYYNIVTKCALKNVPIVIEKIIYILKNYKITREDIQYSKNQIMNIQNFITSIHITNFIKSFYYLIKNLEKIRIF